MNKKVVTMGELMLRLSTPGHKRFIQAESFDAVYGGAEANVAVSLANFGLDTYFVSKLPNNPIGESALNSLRKFGVKTDYISKGGDRLGIYFFEKGTSIRSSKVVYDRANSSMATADPEDFDFNTIFKDADWFHFSGITPALGEKGIKIAKKAVEAAKQNGVKISLDLNYRKQLWGIEQFEKVMPGLLQDIDVCFGWLSSIEEKKDEYQVADFAKEGIYIKRFEEIFSKMIEKFNIKYVVTTMRENFSASHNALSAVIYDGKEIYKSNRYDFNIEDRVGGGDAFAAGLIYGLITEKDYRKALEFGVASSVLKHTIGGDANLVTVDEVMDVVNGNTSGRVKR
ncbi:sugar kinase [Clostridium sp. MB40-C1]|uniref:sugar kinase n=1 Tax=Clostridium sp. MB40-C1 TaxID=3070996 RepID=UPI0027E127D6|nr:sugar kinase [Clostridium sp. MB40-C1]WMJ80934.1 sugar kinase [Clostridium sp. MB40-C1]